MKTSLSPWLFPLLLGALGACSTRPLPPAVVEAQSVADSPAVQEASQVAPQAYALAEQLRSLAEQLHQDGKTEEAELVAEQALAAYEHAVISGRGVRAKLRLEKVEAQLKVQEAELAELDEKQRLAQADADAFELRARIALDTEPVQDVKSVSPERAAARQKAAKKLTSEAQSLCLAASLLDSSAEEQTKELHSQIHQLHTELQQGSVRVDLYPRATQARSSCLRLLTEIRRPVAQKQPEAGTSDQLLTSLTQTGQLFSFRDDRGVVTQILAPVQGGKLTSAAQEALELLGRTSQAHPSFPLLLVVHSARAQTEQSLKEVAERVQEALEQAGSAQVQVHLAGTAEPLIDQRLPASAEQNERVEVIFVSPAF